MARVARGNGELTANERSPDTTKPPGGGFAPTTVDPLRAALSQSRNDPGGEYCKSRQCRDDGLHRITSFRGLIRQPTSVPTLIE